MTTTEPTTTQDAENASVASGEPSDGTCAVCLDLPHPVATHCRPCHSSWTRSTRTAHCPTCCRTFGSPSAFDRHLLKVGCTDPAGVTKKVTGGLFDEREPAYGEPRLNKWGTLVWRLSGERPDPKE